MRYVIIRDDDTNALTPVSCLERLYRPFLERGMPVNLATIPEVSLDTTFPNGKPEGFLAYRNGAKNRTVPIAASTKLVGYLRDNSGFEIVQHGLHHDYLEFDGVDRAIVSDWLDQGTSLLLEAGFARPKTFVAPYDKFSRAALRETAHRFRVVSSGWYELGRVPPPWWPQYAWKKFRGTPHWRIGRTVLLSHPGCLLSCFRPCQNILETIRAQIDRQQLTVLVTHWWEYFREQTPDETFISLLHETAAYLESRRDIRVISFSELVHGHVPLN
jgi:Uncharacterized protein conserved in bacteria (DUF2334).